MATRENSIRTSETATAAAEDNNPSFPNPADSRPSLTAGLTSDVQSMSFASLFNQANNILGGVNKAINIVNTGITTGKKVEQIINGGNNRSPGTSEQAENAFANAIDRVIKQIETPGFKNSSPRRQELWATTESIKLDTLYPKMGRQSQERYAKLYTDLKKTLNEISSGQQSNGNPYDRTLNPTANSNPNAEKAETEFVTTLQKAYDEINSKNFTQSIVEKKSLWATRKLSEAQEKYNNMSPDSQKIYRKNYVAFQNKLNSLGAQGYNASSNELQEPLVISSTSSNITFGTPLRTPLLQSTEYENDLWNS
jgi:hypothetical protein